MKLLLLPYQPLLSEIIMKIETQIFHNDMDEDKDDGVGEISLNSNIFVNITGASPSEKAKVRAILDEFYADIRKAIRTA